MGEIKQCTDCNNSIKKIQKIYMMQAVKWCRFLYYLQVLEFNINVNPVARF